MRKLFKNEYLWLFFLIVTLCLFFYGVYQFMLPNSDMIGSILCMGIGLIFAIINCWIFFVLHCKKRSEKVPYLRVFQVMTGVIGGLGLAYALCAEFLLSVSYKTVLYAGAIGCVAFIAISLFGIFVKR